MLLENGKILSRQNISAKMKSRTIKRHQNAMARKASDCRSTMSFTMPGGATVSQNGVNPEQARREQRANGVWWSKLRSQRSRGQSFSRNDNKEKCFTDCPNIAADRHATQMVSCLKSDTSLNACELIASRMHGNGIRSRESSILLPALRFVLWFTRTLCLSHVERGSGDQNHMCLELSCREKSWCHSL